MSKLDQVLEIDPAHELHFKGMLNFKCVFVYASLVI